MDQDNKIVDIGKFRKTKQEEPNNAKRNWMAVVSDRYAFNLRGDGLFEVIQGGQVIEVREPTYAERQMAVHMLYLEGMVQDLVDKHEPHRKNDDYLTYPYTDWDGQCAVMGKEAVEWNAQFVDEPGVPMQRATHLLVEAVRHRVEMQGYPGKVGLMPQLIGNQYKELTSDRSYFYFRVDDVDAIEGMRFKTHFAVKEGCEHETVVECGDIDVTFSTMEEKIQFLSIVLTCLSAATISELVEDAIKENRAQGSYLVVNRKYPPVPR